MIRAWFSKLSSTKKINAFLKGSDQSLRIHFCTKSIQASVMILSDIDTNEQFVTFQIIA